MIYNFLSRFNGKGLGTVVDNVLPYRSYFIPCSSQRVCDKTDIFSLQNLSDRVNVLREWDFLYFSDGITPTEIEFISSSKVTLPHSFTDGGREKLLVNDGGYAFKSRPFTVPDGKRKNNSAGIYRTYIEMFELTDKYILSFTKVSGVFEIYVNGAYVGLSCVSRAEFDITKFLSAGRNEILVYVKRWTPYSYLDGAGFNITGLCGNVNLISLKKNSLVDYTFTPTSYAGKNSGELTLNFDTGAGGEVAVKICDGESVLFSGIKPIEQIVKFSVTGDFNVYLPEKPIIYDLYIKSGQGQNFPVDECVKVQISFGTLSEEKIYADKNLKVRAITYYAPVGSDGRLITFEQVKKDIALIKEYNFNTVHVVGGVEPYIMQYISAAGLFVIPNFEVDTRACVSFGKKKRDIAADNALFAEAVSKRTMSLYERDKNLPNIILWSFNEEKACGAAFIETLNALRAKVSVPIIFRNPGQEYDYPLVSVFNPSLDEIVDAVNNTVGKTVFIAQFASGEGAGCASFAEFNDIAENTSSILGDCVAEFADRIIGRAGVLDNGIFNAERKPYQSAESYKYICRPVVSRLADGGIEFTNRNQYVKADYTVKLQTVRNGKIITEKAIKLDIPVKGVCSHEISFDKIGGDMYLNVEYINASGVSVATEQLTVSNELLGLKVKNTGSITVNDAGGLLELWFDGGEITFNKHVGTITRYSLLGKEILKPSPVRYGGNAFNAGIDRPFLRNIKNGVGKPDTKVESFNYRTESVEGENMVIVEVTTTMKIKRKPGFMVKDEFTVYGNGTIEFSSQLFPLKNKLPAIDCFGRQIRMKNGFGNIVYYGRGKDSYPDSYRHALMGLHRQTIDKVGEEFSLCQECGNRLDVHYTAVTDDEGDGLMFVAREIPYQLKMSRVSNGETARGYVNGEMPRQSGVYLDISAAVSGIGNSNDGLPLPQYLVKPTEHNLKFSVMPIMHF